MKIKIFIILSMLTNYLLAQDNSFTLSTKNFQPYFPTYIGNGHFSIASTQFGTKSAESYMINVFDRGEDDIPRIANLPAWNEIDYYNGSKWLNGSDTVEIKNYSQKLDMYNGSLETNYKWTVNGKNSDINILSFISRANKNLAIIKFELTTDFSDMVQVSFPVNERDEPERMPLAVQKTIEPNPPGKWPAEWYPGFTEIINISSSAEIEKGHIEAESQTIGKKTKVAQSVEVYYEGTLPKSQILSYEEEKSAGIQINFQPEKGKTYIFYKIVSIVSAFDGGNVSQKAKDISQKAKEKGFNQLFNEHKNAWKKIWNTDIVVEGDDNFQKIIHSMMFYLLCSVDENTGFSIPPMGLATSGYYGHIFWDADTYMFPPLLLMNPEMAKSLVMFRVNTLEAAKENAKKNNYEGAMYPWEADEEGQETTPFFAYQNALQENHINGDVAFAQWQYFTASGDTNWLRDHGAKVIEGTADFWTSRVHYNEEKERYEIGKLVSVSEGLIDINNETYTNVIAKINLELAVKVGKILNKEVNPEWQKISEKMFIPFNEKEQYHPTYDEAGAGEGATELWSSVVNLLSYPLQVEMNDNAKRNNLIHAVNSLGESGAGAMMGTNFVSIIAAELGMDSLFNATIEKTLYGYLRPPYNVLAETHTNNSINFITGAGSFLQQVIFGYTGLRITGEGIVQKYEPMLPDNINSLTLKNFTINNKIYDVIVKAGKIELEAR